MACRIESVAATVPAPEVYPVRTLAITGALVRVVAFPLLVTSPVKLALVVTVPAVSPEAVPVALVRTAADGVPRLGVTKTGEVAKTAAPDPVSSVKAVARLAEEGVARKVATPVPSPLTPLEMGKDVGICPKAAASLAELPLASPVIFWELNPTLAVGADSWSSRV